LQPVIRSKILYSGGPLDRLLFSLRLRAFASDIILGFFAGDGTGVTVVPSCWIGTNGVPHLIVPYRLALSLDWHERCSLQVSIAVVGQDKRSVPAKEMALA